MRWTIRASGVTGTTALLFATASRTASATFSGG